MTTTPYNPEEIARQVTIQIREMKGNTAFWPGWTHSDAQDIILTAMRQAVKESGAVESVEHFAKQPLTTEMTAEDYECGDIDFAHDKLIEESRLLLANLRKLTEGGQDRQSAPHNGQ